eukprot:gene14753-biopygen404
MRGNPDTSVRQVVLPRLLRGNGLGTTCQSLSDTRGRSFTFSDSGLAVEGVLCRPQLPRPGHCYPPQLDISIEV